MASAEQPYDTLEEKFKYKEGNNWKNISNVKVEI